jgi:hypothetical protein
LVDTVDEVLAAALCSADDADNNCATDTPVAQTVTKIADMTFESAK